MTATRTTLMTEATKTSEKISNKSDYRKTRSLSVTSCSIELSNSERKILHWSTLRIILVI